MDRKLYAHNAEVSFSFLVSYNMYCEVQEQLYNVNVTATVGNLARASLLAKSIKLCATTAKRRPMSFSNVESGQFSKPD